MSAVCQASLSFSISWSLLSVHWVGGSVQPSHSLLPASPLAFSLSEYEDLFLKSCLLISDGHSIETSASASVLPVNIQGRVLLGLTGLISLRSKDLSRVFSITITGNHQFFGAQPFLWSTSCICTRRTWQYLSTLLFFSSLAPSYFYFIFLTRPISTAILLPLSLTSVSHWSSVASAWQKARFYFSAFSLPTVRLLSHAEGNTKPWRLPLVFNPSKSKIAMASNLNKVSGLSSSPVELCEIYYFVFVLHSGYFRYSCVSSNLWFWLPHLKQMNIPPTS